LCLPACPPVCLPACRVTSLVRTAGALATGPAGCRGPTPARTLSDASQPTRPCGSGCQPGAAAAPCGMHSKGTAAAIFAGGSGSQWVALVTPCGATLSDCLECGGWGNGTYCRQHQQQHGQGRGCSQGGCASARGESPWERQLSASAGNRQGLLPAVSMVRRMQVGERARAGLGLVVVAAAVQTHHGACVCV
jgi:hypothetical protein